MANQAKWYIVDAKDQVVGRLASLLAGAIRGKHKPQFAPSEDHGDHIVVINADKVVFTRNKWDKKIYYRHTGYVGGVKRSTAREMLQRKPTEILRKAVFGMMGKNKLSKAQMCKLKIYASEQHPHEAQKPEVLPKSLLRRSCFTQNTK